jgi:hypothetical protein
VNVRRIAGEKRLKSSYLGESEDSRIEEIKKFLPR